MENFPQVVPHKSLVSYLQIFFFFWISIYLFIYRFPEYRVINIIFSADKKK